MKPTDKDWPIKLAKMINKAIEVIKGVKDSNDVDAKISAIESITDMGFPGTGSNKDSSGK